jgi:hypothetical protein
VENMNCEKCGMPACTSISFKANPDYDDFKYIHPGDIVVVYLCKKCFYKKEK